MTNSLHKLHSDIGDYGAALSALASKLAQVGDELSLSAQTCCAEPSVENHKTLLTGMGDAQAHVYAALDDFLVGNLPNAQEANDISNSIGVELEKIVASSASERTALAYAQIKGVAGTLEVEAVMESAIAAQEELIRSIFGDYEVIEVQGIHGEALIGGDESQRLVPRFDWSKGGTSDI